MTLEEDANNFFELQSKIQQEYKILAEYKMILGEDIGGIYVIPSHESSFSWFGVFFVREGLYKNGIFRFTISLPEDFPNTTELPKINFQSEIIHPLICKYTGLLEISEFFPKWLAGENHIWQILKLIKFLFQQPLNCSYGKVANKEVLELLQHNKEMVFGKIKDSIRISLEKIYDSPPTDDKHYIVFDRFDEDLHGTFLTNIKKNIVQSTLISSTPSPPPSCGLSWVNTGEFKPLSK